MGGRDIFGTIYIGTVSFPSQVGTANIGWKCRNFAKISGSYKFVSKLRTKKIIKRVIRHFGGYREFSSIKVIVKMLS